MLVSEKQILLSVNKHYHDVIIVLNFYVKEIVCVLVTMLQNYLGSLY